MQRRSNIDTNTKADWSVAPGNIGAFNSGPCFANEHVVSSGCVACPAGQSNLPGDSPAGPEPSVRSGSDPPDHRGHANQTGSRDLIELQVLAGGTLRDLTITQDGAVLATLPDVTVSAGQLVMVHLTPAAGVTTKLTAQGDCSNVACFAQAWDVNGGATGITFTRRVLAVVNPSGDLQDAVAFSNQTTSPAGYVTQLQAVQTSGNWPPASCGGIACASATIPTRTPCRSTGAAPTAPPRPPTPCSALRRSTPTRRRTGASPRPRSACLDLRQRHRRDRLRRRGARSTHEDCCAAYWPGR